MLAADKIRWPTKRYVHEAIDLLERWHQSGYDVTTVPEPFRQGTWEQPRGLRDWLSL